MIIVGILAVVYIWERIRSCCVCLDTMQIKRAVYSLRNLRSSCINWYDTIR